MGQKRPGSSHLKGRGGEKGRKNTVSCPTEIGCFYAKRKVAHNPEWDGFWKPVLFWGGKGRREKKQRGGLKEREQKGFQKRSEKDSDEESSEPPRFIKRKKERRKPGGNSLWQLQSKGNGRCFCGRRA